MMKKLESEHGEIKKITLTYADGTEKVIGKAFLFDCQGEADDKSGDLEVKVHIINIPIDELWKIGACLKALVGSSEGRFFVERKR